MKKTYPIIITRDKQYYVVYIPDLDINAEGESIEDAVQMAQEAIGLWGICQIDMGKTLPEPSNLTAEKDGEIVMSVDVDFELYRNNIK